MSCKRFAICLASLALAVFCAVPAARAQGAPAGYLLDVDTVNPGVLSSYTEFSTSFVADNSSEYVSFAFRETPAFFAFSDPVVELQSTTTNLLSNPLFQGATYGQNCDDQGENSLGCPPSWGTWIEPVDTSAIGQIADSSAHYGCNVGPFAGTNYWCDGSVQGYDAIYQQLTGLIVGDTYDISFWLEDDSGDALTSATSTNCTVLGNSCIDAVVYAGDNLPLGTINLAPGPAPEPSSLLLLGTGLSGLAAMWRRRRMRA